MTRTEPYHVLLPLTSPAPTGDSLEETPCSEVAAARERFQALHGPEAELRRPRRVSKELRKAQVAAEMARWECF